MIDRLSYFPSLPTNDIRLTINTLENLSPTSQTPRVLARLATSNAHQSEQ